MIIFGRIVCGQRYHLLLFPKLRLRCLFLFVVALHLTVVQLTCNENGGPNILLLACFHTTPGGPSWTPQPHSAPIGTVLPEAKRARAISVSIRRRNNGSSVTSVTQPSAPAKAPSSIGCAPRQRPW